MIKGKWDNPSKGVELSLNIGIIVIEKGTFGVYIYIYRERESERDDRSFLFFYVTVFIVVLVYF